jgi:hypothetical protein
MADTAAPAKKKPRQTIDQWTDEARQTAKEAIRRGAELEAGDVHPRDPALRYIVIDGELPKGRIAHHRAQKEALGYRDVTADIEFVVEYTSFIVYAIPIEVYRDTIRPERVRRLTKKTDQYGIVGGQVVRKASAGFS